MLLRVSSPKIELFIALLFATRSSNKRGQRKAEVLEKQFQA